MTRGASLVWPERKRCYRCRRYFGFEIIRGLYCSRECAGLAPIVRVESVPLPKGTVIRTLPRSCRTVMWKGPKAKQRFRTMAEAEQAAEQQENDPEIQAYECPNCKFYHLGHGQYIEATS
jgi:hypothetical protein